MFHAPNWQPLDDAQDAGPLPWPEVGIAPVCRQAQTRTCEPNPCE